MRLLQADRTTIIPNRNSTIPRIGASRNHHQGAYPELLAALELLEELEDEELPPPPPAFM